MLMCTHFVPGGGGGLKRYVLLTFLDGPLLFFSSEGIDHLNPGYVRQRKKTMLCRRSDIYAYTDGQT